MRRNKPILSRPAGRLLALTAMLASIALPARAQTPTRPRATQSVRPSGAPLLIAANSRLPVPAGAKLIADTRSGPYARITLPGLPTGAASPPPIVREIRLLIYQPKTGGGLAQAVQFLTKRQRLQTGQRPEFRTRALPTGASFAAGKAAAEQTAVYRSQSPSGQMLLGARRQSGQEFIYVVLVRGKLSAVQTHIIAKAAVESVLSQVENARRDAALRERLPEAPPIFGRPYRIYRVTEKTVLQAMQKSINSDPGVSAQVKRLVTAVFSQASAVEVSKYVAQRAVTVAEARAFFQAQASARKWRFVTAYQDGTDKATLLYQLPDEQGVLMVRSEPRKPSKSALPRLGLQRAKGTTLVFLRLEGKIDVNRLLTDSANADK